MVFDGDGQDDYSGGSSGELTAAEECPCLKLLRALRKRMSNVYVQAVRRSSVLLPEVGGTNTTWHATNVNNLLFAVMLAVTEETTNPRERLRIADHHLKPMCRLLETLQASIDREMASAAGARSDGELVRMWTRTGLGSMLEAKKDAAWVLTRCKDFCESPVDGDGQDDYSGGSSGELTAAEECPCLKLLRALRKRMSNVYVQAVRLSGVLLNGEGGANTEWHATNVNNLLFAVMLAVTEETTNPRERLRIADHHLKPVCRLLETLQASIDREMASAAGARSDEELVRTWTRTGLGSMLDAKKDAAWVLTRCKDFCESPELASYAADLGRIVPRCS